MDLYDYNHTPLDWASGSLHAWAGAKEHLGLQVIYTLAFLLLLRSNKVLKLRFEHITLGVEEGLVYIKVVLPFRKTEKYGGMVPVRHHPNTFTHQNRPEIKPFVVWKLDKSEAHLCPVCAFAHYISATRITSSYLFCLFMTGDRISANNVALVRSTCPLPTFFQRDSWLSKTSKNFLEKFRNNLVDISLDPACYGTHSFRRGGCQYLSSHRHWLF